VTQDVAPNSTVAGVPARPMRHAEQTVDIRALDTTIDSRRCERA
jgi:acetyltransferase-like isoleucine patch superfamily enzyme